MRTPYSETMSAEQAKSVNVERLGDGSAAGGAAVWSGQVDPQLVVELDALRDALLAAERQHAGMLGGLGPAARASAANLVHYLAFRSRDLREMQRTLADMGLSSLGRSEGSVLATLDRVRGILALLRRVPLQAGAGAASPAPATADEAGELLEERTSELLGPMDESSGSTGEARPPRRTRIMVTMPSEAATDPRIISDLLDGGMNVMRINCAHDGPEAWAAMIGHLRRIRGQRPCPVLMDIPGPKVRTGAIRPGHAVIKIAPPLDELGRPVRAARVLLTSAAEASEPVAVMPAGAAGQDDDPSVPDVCVPVVGPLVAGLAVGCRVRLRDTRNRLRTLTVAAAHERGWMCHCDRTTYLVPGMELRAKSVGTGAEAGHAGRQLRGVVGEVPAGAGVIVLRERDLLVLTRDPVPGGPAEADPVTGVTRPARIPFTLPQVFGDLRPGQRVLLDDGKIEGRVQTVTAAEVTLMITRARPGGSKLREAKGVNFPDAELSIDPLTPEDLADLPFIAANADMVGFSFVRRAADVRSIRAHLARLGGKHVGVVLKIETAAAFTNLPELLLEALGQPCAGVMIARGDLAVEVGWERLAEVQEEILWLCEAAHVPVIWATQVLESLAKKGLPSRSEITDAAMGQRAECVMLNKGPFVVRAVRMLDDILRRMSEHQSKKRSMLRRLKVAGVGGGAKFTGDQIDKLSNEGRGLS